LKEQEKNSGRKYYDLSGKRRSAKSQKSGSRR
jgi:hypothetical protein